MIYVHDSAYVHSRFSLVLLHSDPIYISFYLHFQHLTQSIIFACERLHLSTASRTRPLGLPICLPQNGYTPKDCPGLARQINGLSRYSLLHSSFWITRIWCFRDLRHCKSHEHWSWLYDVHLSDSTKKKWRYCISKAELSGWLKNSFSFSELISTILITWSNGNARKRAKDLVKSDDVSCFTNQNESLTHLKCQKGDRPYSRPETVFPAFSRSATPRDPQYKKRSLHR